TLRTDEPPHAQPAVEAIRALSSRARLRGLSPADVAELVHGAFGEEPGLGRLTRWLHGIAGASPLHCTEVLRYLVDRGHVRWAMGAWVVPEDLAAVGHVPLGLREALDGTVERLRAATLDFAQTLAVHGGELDLDLCSWLAHDSATVFDALDELEQSGVLV